jgi:hypothetical protein
LIQDIPKLVSTVAAQISLALFKMEFKNIKRKLAKAPKYSTLTGKKPAVCRPVRLEHTDEDVFCVYVLAMFSGNQVYKSEIS